VRASFVIDSSIAMAWCFQDKATPTTDIDSVPHRCAMGHPRWGTYTPLWFEGSRERAYSGAASSPILLS